jgi:hypothetical protein
LGENGSPDSDGGIVEEGDASQSVVSKDHKYIFIVKKFSENDSVRLLVFIFMFQLNFRQMFTFFTMKLKN